MRTSKGWLQPEIEYVYEIAMPPDVDASIFEPKPHDGEVECFEVGEGTGWSNVRADGV